mmetsp:Transcript_70130/g.150171  ORF Transcript_70130/g.150171 Transcript_70130/m.150171 type:complete len:373 (+) Transcript_70130:652-1770(+)
MPSPSARGCTAGTERVGFRGVRSPRSSMAIMDAGGWNNQLRHVRGERRRAAIARAAKEIATLRAQLQYCSQHMHHDVDRQCDTSKHVQSQNQVKSLVDSASNVRAEADGHSVRDGPPVVSAEQKGGMPTAMRQLVLTAHAGTQTDMLQVSDASVQTSLSVDEKDTVVKVQCAKIPIYANLEEQRKARAERKKAHTHAVERNRQRLRNALARPGGGKYIVKRNSDEFKTLAEAADSHAAASSVGGVAPGDASGLARLHRGRVPVDLRLGRSAGHSTATGSSRAAMSGDGAASGDAGGQLVAGGFALYCPLLKGKPVLCNPNYGTIWAVDSVNSDDYGEDCVFVHSVDEPWEKSWCEAKHFRACDRDGVCLPLP